MIAGGAFYTSAGGQKGLKTFGTGPSAGKRDCAHKAGDGTNVEVTGAARLYRVASVWTAGLSVIRGNCSRSTVGLQKLDHLLVPSLLGKTQ